MHKFLACPGFAGIASIHGIEKFRPTSARLVLANVVQPYCLEVKQNCFLLTVVYFQSHWGKHIPSTVINASLLIHKGMYLHIMKLLSQSGSSDSYWACGFNRHFLLIAKSCLLCMSCSNSNWKTLWKVKSEMSCVLIWGSGVLLWEVGIPTFPSATWHQLCALQTVLACWPSSVYQCHTKVAWQKHCSFVPW